MPHEQMVGRSQPFLASLRLIERFGRCDAPVLIEGETGTGKELAARAVHYAGARKEGPFIPVNCGAIPDSLVENELFGHKSGAYTDARRDHLGLVAHAHHGTLFLDEVDALTQKAQVTLLRFLQDRQYRPLGGGEARTADLRLITACNADLVRLAEAGAFRVDLMYRIALLHLRLPPLRERGSDVLLLAEHVLRDCAARYGVEKRLDGESREWLLRQRWPGNIRELQNLICREYLLTDEPVIRLGAPEPRPEDAPERTSTTPAVRFGEAKTRAVRAFERDYLLDALASAGGNVTRAAQLAGKERRAFGKLLKKYGIERGQHFG
jgi:two-component system, NtrC family, response regulator GlrR